MNLNIYIQKNDGYLDCWLFFNDIYYDLTIMIWERQWMVAKVFDQEKKTQTTKIKKIIFKLIN